jgi:hypothetical protein
VTAILQAKLGLVDSQAWIKQRTENCQQIEMICGPVPCGLDSDESVVFALPGIHLLEPRSIRRSRSYYGGPTIRLQKACRFGLAQAPVRARIATNCAILTRALWC